MGMSIFLARNGDSIILLFVTGTNTTAALAAAQMMQVMICMNAMAAMTAVAQQGQPYQATTESAAKAKGSVAAALPSRRTKKLSAMDKHRIHAAKWGIAR